jgi:hypothetical protein
MGAIPEDTELESIDLVEDAMATMRIVQMR